MAEEEEAEEVAKVVWTAAGGKNWRTWSGKLVTECACLANTAVMFNLTLIRMLV